MAAVARVGRLLRRAGLVAAFTAASGALVLAQRSPEYQVKAAYLYGFGRFVEWPGSASPGSNLFVVCVLGDDPFGRWLDDVVAGAVMKDKPVSVRRIAQLEDSSVCHTLFISASESARLGQILETLDRRPVLTVSDTPQFVQRGGMIGFSLDGKRVRFTVNLGAAQDAGLLLNSELLRVAATVLRRPSGD